jgi:hypothetical protein
MNYFFLYRKRLAWWLFWRGVICQLVIKKQTIDDVLLNPDLPSLLKIFLTVLRTRWKTQDIHIPEDVSIGICVFYVAFLHIICTPELWPSSFPILALIPRFFRTNYSISLAFKPCIWFELVYNILEKLRQNELSLFI